MRDMATEAEGVHLMRFGQLDARSGMQGKKIIQEWRKNLNQECTLTVYIWPADGAEGGIRTPTPHWALDPEPSASTNSATSARRWIVINHLLKYNFFYSRMSRDL